MYTVQYTHIVFYALGPDSRRYRHDDFMHQQYERVTNGAGNRRRGVCRMSPQYITSEDHLPSDTGGEVTVQVTNQETKEIFQTRARLSRDSHELDDPEPLTVLRGPHENVEEQWYIEIIEADLDGAPVDDRVLDRCIEQSRTQSDVVTVRSEDVRALVTYLVETGEYDSVSEAVRTFVTQHLAETRPLLLDRYVERRVRLEQDDLSRRLTGGDET